MKEIKLPDSFTIYPQNLPNDGILFIDHQSNGRSGHNGHSLIEYKDNHILSFYFNGSADEKTIYGHHPHGWTEYKRSMDGGKTWGDPIILDYSKEIFDNPDYFSAYIKQTLLAPDGTIIAIGCRFLKNYPEFDKAFYIKSYDEGKTWTVPKDFGDDDPVFGRPQATFEYNGTIFVLFTHGSVWGENHPHRLYVSTDNGETFARRSDLTLDTECWYGAMTVLDNDNIIAYGYREKDEHNLQYVISDDDGFTWSEPATTYLSKKIRNPILSEKIGDYYFMHGRSGHYGEECGNLVLYSSRDAIHWDSGVFLNKSQGTYAYSANLVVGKFNPDKEPQLLIQSSIAYDGKRRVNVHHWWIKNFQNT